RTHHRRRCDGGAPLNRDWLVAQAFQPAGSGDFRVARPWSTGLESPVTGRLESLPYIQIPGSEQFIISTLRLGVTCHVLASRTAPHFQQAVNCLSDSSPHTRQIHEFPPVDSAFHNAPRSSTAF